MSLVFEVIVQQATTYPKTHLKIIFFSHFSSMRIVQTTKVEAMAMKRKVDFVCSFSPLEKQVKNA